MDNIYDRTLVSAGGDVYYIGRGGMVEDKGKMKLLYGSIIWACGLAILAMLVAAGKVVIDRRGDDTNTLDAYIRI